MLRKCFWMKKLQMSTWVMKGTETISSNISHGSNCLYWGWVDSVEQSSLSLFQWNCCKNTFSMFLLAWFVVWIIIRNFCNMEKSLLGEKCKLWCRSICPRVPVQSEGWDGPCDRTCAPSSDAAVWRTGEALTFPLLSILRSDFLYALTLQRSNFV